MFGLCGAAGFAGGVVSGGVGRVGPAPDPPDDVFFAEHRRAPLTLALELAEQTAYAALAPVVFIGGFRRVGK